MMKLSNVMKNNINYILNCKRIDWNLLNGKTILVTGATGLIGSTLVNALLYKGNINVVALIRNNKSISDILIDSDKLQVVYGNIESDLKIDCKIDYIIHGASPTQSSYFVNNPVETMKTNIFGTINTLELANEKNVISYVYLSSMEAYGNNVTDDPIAENKVSNILSTEIRNSYPISKIASENLCVDYASEHNVNAKIVRLAQTFGPGVKYNDTRVFAEFARCVIDNKDIVLKTKGETKRTYCHVADAVIGILTVLLNGKNGELYNIVNEDTFCSIKAMAELVANDVANGAIKVVINESQNVGNQYMKPHSYNLDSKKVRDLGFKPQKGLKEMYVDMIEEVKWNAISTL